MLLDKDAIKNLLERIEKVKGLENVDNKQDKVIKEFYQLYNEAYQELLKSTTDLSKGEEAIKSAGGTQEYTIFESFISNCLIEHAMWGLGSRKISFKPYQALYDYFFGNSEVAFTRGKALTAYIETEVQEMANRK